MFAVHFFFLLLNITILITFCQNYPINLDASQVTPKITPVDFMVDTTNNLAFKVLYLHSISNKNNIAFSPCGLISVLVALYEGSDGKSALEIQNSLQFPWEKDIIRVGYRDIHRRLRTYFYHQENILSGMSLSKENVTIRPEYETILKFYGYEVDGVSFNPSTRIQSTTLQAQTTVVYEEEDPTKVTINTDNTKKFELTTMTTYISSTKESISNLPTITPTEITSLEFSTATTDLTTVPNTTMNINTFKTQTPTQNETTIPAPLNPITRMPATTLTTENTDLPTRVSTRRERKTMRFPRSSMEYEISAYETTPSYFTYQATPNPQFGTIEYETKFLQPDLNEEIVHHFFYLSHIEMTQVPYKFYNTILKYGYFEHIRSSVLELELDSDNYKMMIILPDYDYGLENLLPALNSNYSKSLREIRKSLSPTWIKAIVPKFNLKGNIVLTSDLQNIGIEDIFEPTRADFSSMTEQQELLYVRNVEQKVKINIRTQTSEHLKRHTTFYKSPIEISVNHPFIFLIIDTELDLSIIAGRVLNPLNSRIQ